MWPFTLVFSDTDLFVINEKTRTGEGEREGGMLGGERGGEGREGSSDTCSNSPLSLILNKATLPPSMGP